MAVASLHRPVICCLFLLHFILFIPSVIASSCTTNIIPRAIGTNDFYAYRIGDSCNVTLEHDNMPPPPLFPCSSRVIHSTSTQGSKRFILVMEKDPIHPDSWKTQIIGPFKAGGKMKDTHKRTDIVTNQLGDHDACTYLHQKPNPRLDCFCVNPGGLVNVSRFPIEKSIASSPISSSFQLPPKVVGNLSIPLEGISAYSIDGVAILVIRSESKFLWRIQLNSNNNIEDIQVQGFSTGKVMFADEYTTVTSQYDGKGVANFSIADKVLHPPFLCFANNSVGPLGILALKRVNVPDSVLPPKRITILPPLAVQGPRWILVEGSLTEEWLDPNWVILCLFLIVFLYLLLFFFCLFVRLEDDKGKQIRFTKEEKNRMEHLVVAGLETATIKTLPNVIEPVTAISDHSPPQPPQVPTLQPTQEDEVDVEAENEKNEEKEIKMQEEVMEEEEKSPPTKYGLTQVLALPDTPETQTQPTQPSEQTDKTQSDSVRKGLEPPDMAQFERKKDPPLGRRKKLPPIEEIKEYDDEKCQRDPSMHDRPHKRKSSRKWREKPPKRETPLKPPQEPPQPERRDDSRQSPQAKMEESPREIVPSPSDRSIKTSDRNSPRIPETPKTPTPDSSSRFIPIESPSTPPVMDDGHQCSNIAGCSSLCRRVRAIQNHAPVRGPNTRLCRDNDEGACDIPR